MRRTYGKNTRRTIKETFGRFAAIFAIVALGVGFLAGLLSSTPDMRISFDAYFDKTAMYDIRILGDMGFTESDITRLKALDAVDRVQAGYIADVLMSSSKGSDYTVRMLSCGAAGSGGALNNPILTSGRLPQGPGECLLVNVPLESKAKAEIGDTFAVSENSKNADDLLRVKKYTVVGFADYSPHFSADKEYTNIGSGTVDLFLLAPVENFKTGIYTDVYITVKGARNLLSMSDEYKALIGKATDEIKNISGVQCVTRYNEILGEAEDKVSGAKATLDSSKSEADTELSEAQNKLAQGRAEIGDGEKRLSDARKQIDENEAALDKSESDLNNKEKTASEQFADAEKKIADAQSALDSRKAEAALKTGEAEKQLNTFTLSASQKNAFDALRKLAVKYPTLPDDMTELSRDSARLQEIGKRLSQIGMMSKADQAAHSDEIASLTKESGSLQAEVGKISSSPEYSAYKSAVAGLAAAGADYNSLVPLALTLGALDNAAVQISSGQAQLDSQRAELKGRESDTAKQIADARQQLSDARAQLGSAKKEYNGRLSELGASKSLLAENQRKYEDAKAKADKEIAEGEQKIADAQSKISDIKAPEWKVYSREDNISYASIKANIDKVNAIAKIFPFFFFLVAALVASTTMTRMIEDERLQIGTMKALGYSRASIMGKYVIYSLAASLLGSAFGIAVGYRLFPSVIWNAYTMMYDLPNFICPLNWTYALTTSCAVTLCILLATLNACRATLREKPAELMLPRAPKAGKRVLLERVTFIWSRMRFTHKVTARNLFRYKKRFFMTVIGVAGCTSLLVAGFGMRDSFNDIADKQFGELCTYNIYAPISGEEALSNADLCSLLNDSGSVSGSTPVYLENVTLTYGKKAFDVNTFIPQKASDLNGYVKFQTMGSHKPINFGEGSVILTQKASEILGVRVGESVTLTDMDGKAGSFTISGICENYVRNYIYMSESTFKAAMGHEDECNMLAIRLRDDSADAQAAFGKQLLATNAVGGVTFTANSRDAVARALSKIDMIVVVIIISAGALALVVLYNLININISERIKEIATIKVLGFTNREVNAYINRETMILSVIGTLFGLFLGIFLHRYIMGQAEMDSIIFGRTVKAMSFVYSSVLTMAFSFFVDLILHRKLRNISMVESMKAPE